MPDAICRAIVGAHTAAPAAALIAAPTGCSLDAGGGGLHQPLPARQPCRPQRRRTQAAGRADRRVQQPRALGQLWGVVAAQLHTSLPIFLFPPAANQQASVAWRSFANSCVSSARFCLLAMLPKCFFLPCLNESAGFSNVEILRKCLLRLYTCSGFTMTLSSRLFHAFRLQQRGDLPQVPVVHAAGARL